MSHISSPTSRVLYQFCQYPKLNFGLTSLMSLFPTMVLNSLRSLISPLRISAMRFLWWLLTSWIRDSSTSIAMRWACRRRGVRRGSEPRRTQRRRNKRRGREKSQERGKNKGSNHRRGDCTTEDWKREEFRVLWPESTCSCEMHFNTWPHSHPRNPNSKT